MIRANGTASKIEVINMAECFRNVLSRLRRESPRDRSSVKGHAVCSVADLTFFYWGFRETCFASDENCDRYADTIWLSGWARVGAIIAGAVARQLWRAHS